MGFSASPYELLQCNRVADERVLSRHKTISELFVEGCPIQSSDLCKFGFGDGMFYEGFIQIDHHSPPSTSLQAAL